MIHKSLDAFFEEDSKWKKEYAYLRKLMLQTGLQENIKWGKPCYTYQKQNVVLIHGFKEYCALLFPKGALLQDSDKILVQQTENVQAARQIRFKNLEEIKAMKNSILAYIYEAIEAEKAGLRVTMKKTSDFEVVQEFQHALENDQLLRASFEALTPGRQRAYLLFFASAKRSETRIKRIENYHLQILQGKGINE